MPRTCSLCAHADAITINENVVLHRHSNRRIASQFGVSETAVRRHKRHIPELLFKARDDLEGYEAGSILQRIEDLERRTLERLEILENEDDPDHRTILLAIREQRANIELVAKIRQLIDQAPRQVNVVLIAPEVRDAIVQALAPYGEARLAVVDALEPFEDAS